MISDRYDLVVVGASVAAEALAARLRELAFEGSVLVVDRDERMPYERPPLSKAFLTAPDDTEIDVDWETTDVVIGTASDVEPAAKRLRVERASTGESTSVEYGTLVIATGASPVRLPIEPDGVLHLRTVADSEQIRAAAAAGSRVGIIGAGAIGAELATSLSANGAEVVLLDKADRPLERLLAGHLGADVTSWLTDRGITCRLGVDITGIAATPAGWTVALAVGAGADDELLQFDVLISAVGARPITGWLEGSGLLTDGQLVCDETGQVITADGRIPAVYGIGDVVTRQDASGMRSRTESWSAAVEQGRTLGTQLAGEPAEETELPYFWTDVAGRKVQVLGTPTRDGAIDVIFENPDRGAVLYTVTGNDGTIGWIGVNAPAKIAMLRMGRS